MSSIIFNITQGLKKVENLLESVDQKAAEFRDRAINQKSENNESIEREIEDFENNINEEDILSNEEDSVKYGSISSEVSDEYVEEDFIEYKNNENVNNTVNDDSANINDESESLDEQKIDKNQIPVNQSHGTSKSLSLGKLKKDIILLKKENEKLVHHNKKIQEENTKLNNKLKVSENHISELKLSNENINNELNNIKSISKEKERAFQLLATKYDDLEQKFQKLSIESEESSKNYQETIESLKQEINKAQEKVKNIENSYTEYKIKARKVLNEKDELIAQLKSNSLKNDDHKKDQHEQNVSNDNSEENSSNNNLAELYMAKKLIKQIRSEKKILEEQLKEMEDISIKSQHKILEMKNDYDTKIEEMKKAIDIKDKTISAQKELNMTLQRNLDSSNQIIAKLNSTIENNKKTISQLEEQLAKVQKDYYKMKILPQQYRELEERIAYLNEQLLKKQSKIDLLLQEKSKKSTPTSSTSLPYPSTMKSEVNHWRNDILFKISKSEAIVKLSSFVPKSNLARAALILYLIVLQMWTMYILLSSMRSIQSNK